MSTPAANIKTPDPYESLLDSYSAKPPPAVTRTSNRYGAYDLNTEGAWTLSSDAPKVKDWYKSTYGRDLPVSAFGQSRRHSGMGLNHSNSMDVGLNPTSAEGRALISHLRESNIPFLAYDRAVPGAATAAHVHVGFPSHGFGVTPQQKSSGRQQQDPYESLLSDIEKQAAPQPTPQPVDDYEKLLDTFSSPAPTPSSQGEAVGATPTNLPSRGATQSPANLFAPGTPTRRGQTAVRGTVINRAPSAQTVARRTAAQGQDLNEQLKEALERGQGLEGAGVLAEGRTALGASGVSRAQGGASVRGEAEASGYRNPDHILARAILETDPAKRRAGMEEAERVASAPLVKPVRLTPQDREDVRREIEMDAQSSALYRVFKQPAQEFSAGIGAQVGNLLERLGVAPQLASTLRHNAFTNALVAGTDHAKDDLPGVLETISKGAYGATLNVAELAVLHRATGAPLSVLLASQSLAQNMDKPLEERAHKAGEAAAFGVVLDKIGGLTRLQGAVGFGVGEPAMAYAEGERNPRRLLGRAAGGAVTGGVFAGGEDAKTVGERARDYVQRGIESDLRSGAPAETIAPPVNVRARGSSARGQNALVGAEETGGAERSGRGEVVSPPPVGGEAPPAHHSNYQPRRARNTATGSKGQFKEGKPSVPEDIPQGVERRADGRTPETDFQYFRTALADKGVNLVKAPRGAYEFQTPSDAGLINRVRVNSHAEMTAKARQLLIQEGIIDETAGRRSGEAVRPEGPEVASGQAGEVQQPGATGEALPESKEGAGQAEGGVAKAAKVALEPPGSVIARLTFGNEQPISVERGVYRTTTARGREYSFDLHTYKLADGRERLLLSAGNPEELVDAGAVVRPEAHGVVVETIHAGETGFKGLGGVLARQIKKRYGEIIPDAEAPLSDAGRRATEKIVARQSVGRVPPEGEAGTYYAGTEAGKPQGRYVYLTENPDYAKNFGPDVKEYRFKPKKTFDLTDAGERPLGLERFKGLMKRKGVNISDFKGDADTPAEYQTTKPAWMWLRRFPQLADRVKAAGYDSIAQLETFAGKGKKERTLQVLDDAALIPSATTKAETTPPAVRGRAKVEKPPTRYQQTGIRRKPSFDPETHDLTRFVISEGGIRVDRDRANTGEVMRLHKLRPGLINKSGKSVEEMARAAGEAGFNVGEGGSATARRTTNLNAGVGEPDPNAFLTMLEEDAGGLRKHHTNAAEISRDELDELNPSEREEFDNEMQFLADPHVAKSLREVQGGKEDAGLREELYTLAANYGLTDDAVDTHLEYARENGVAGQGAREAGAQENQGQTPNRPTLESLRPAEQPSMLPEGGGLFTGEAEKAPSVGGRHPADVQREQLLGRGAEKRTEKLRQTFGDAASALEELSKVSDAPVRKAAHDLISQAGSVRQAEARDKAVALAKFADLRSKGQSVSEYERQNAMFGEQLSPEQMKHLRGMARSIGREGEAGKIDLSFLAPAAQRLRKALGMKEPATPEPSFRLRGKRENEQAKIEPDVRGRVATPVDESGDTLGGERGRASVARTETATPTVKERSFPRSAEAAEPGDYLTGAKVAVTRAEREKLGQPPADLQAWKSVEDSYKAGKAQVEQGKIDPQKVAEEVARKPRPLTAEETGALTYERAKIITQHGLAFKDALRAMDAKNEVDAAEARVRMQGLEDRLRTNSDALEKGGREQSAAFNARKMLVKADYSLAHMVDRYRAETGKEPSAEVRKQIETQAVRIKELEGKLAEHQEKLAKQDAENAVGRMKADSAGEARQARRAQTKQTLDEEFASLKAQFAKAKAEVKGVQPSGLASIDPEGKLTPLVLKMARNRVRAGVNTVEGLVDEIHSALKEHVEGLTKRDVRDLISGYGREAKDSRDADAKELARLRSEMQKLSKQEDVKAGVRSARREGPPDWLPAAKQRLQRQIDEYERKVREKDFSKPERVGLVYDREGNRLKAQLESTKQDYENLKERDRLANRPGWEKGLDLAVRWGRFAKLTYLSTMGKLTSAATGRIVLNPLEEIVGGVESQLMPGLARRAPREGGLSVKAEVASVSRLWQKESFRAFLDKLKTGQSDLDLLYGSGGKALEEQGIGGRVLGAPGRAHGAMKELPRQAEFYRAFEKRLEYKAREGRDIKDPMVQKATAMEAYADSQRTVLMQPNFLSDAFNRTMRNWEREGGSKGKLGAKLMRLEFPITRIPVNFAGEALNYTFGPVRAGAQTAYLQGRAGVRGLKGEGFKSGFAELTPEQADSLMRAWKKGGVGLGMVALGFLAPGTFGGYYQRGEKRAGDEPGAGELRLFGHNLPRWAGHIPILEAAQFGATMRRAYDAMTEKGETPFQAARGGVYKALGGLGSEVPFFEEPVRVAESVEGGREGVERMAGEHVRGMIPGAFQEVSRYRDRYPSGETVKRKRESFQDEVIEGTPWRKNLSIGPVFGSRPSKGSEEVQRLGMQVRGVERKDDEELPHYEARKARVNAKIGRKIDDKVSTDYYRTLSDEKKREAIRKAIRDTIQ